MSKTDFIPSSDVDNRPLLHTDKPEIRRYAGVFMLKNQEIGQYSDEVVVNCAP